MSNAEREAEKCKNYRNGVGICFICFKEAIQRAEQRGLSEHVGKYEKLAYRKGLLRAAEIAKKMPMDFTLGELNGLERNAFYMSSCKIAEAIRKEAND